MRFATSLTWVALLTLAPASTCLGAIVTVGDIVEGNSFKQRWRHRKAERFDHVQARVTRSGHFKNSVSSLLGNGIDGFSRPSWSLLFNDGKTLAARGDEVDELEFDLVFDNTWGDDEEFEIDFQAYKGRRRVENIRIKKLKLGRGWQFFSGVWDRDEPLDQAVVPEPSSIFIWTLVGLTFAGAGWWRRRTAA